MQGKSEMEYDFDARQKERDLEKARGAEQDRKKANQLADNARRLATSISFYTRTSPKVEQNKAIVGQLYQDFPSCRCRLPCHPLRTQHRWASPNLEKDRNDGCSVALAE
jgi:hypothetical protein